jgi:multimeric flavodoxin WrbA
VGVDCKPVGQIICKPNTDFCLVDRPAAASCEWKQTRACDDKNSLKDFAVFVFPVDSSSVAAVSSSFWDRCLGMLRAPNPDSCKKRILSPSRVENRTRSLSNAVKFSASSAVAADLATF